MNTPDLDNQPEEEPNFAIGPPIVGSILTGIIAWSLYVREIEIAMFVIFVLAVLTIAAANINKK